MRTRYGMLIGERTAEDVKIDVGSAYPTGKDDSATVVRGRDLATGLPKSIKISAAEIREALSSTVTQIISGVQEILEETPPELLTDIVERGIFLAGGGSLLRGLDKRLAEETKLPIYVASDPLTTVVRGCGEVLNNLDLLSKVKVTGGLR
jgi:rod shape-determining protein MreB and related proteins